MIEILNSERLRIVNEIIFTIKNKNLDIETICQHLYLEPNYFIQMLKYPNKKISEYLEMLDLVNSL